MPPFLILPIQIIPHLPSTLLGMPVHLHIHAVQSSASHMAVAQCKNIYIYADTSQDIKHQNEEKVGFP